MTFGRAAELADAGDTVTIMPGTYREAITVRHSGTVEKPIVFQATWPRSVILTSDTHYTLVQPARDANRRQSAFYVTMRGIVFGKTPFRNFSGFNDAPPSVILAKGWRLEDCTVERNMGLSFGNTREWDGDDVTLLRTIIQDSYSTGAGAAGDGDAKPPRLLENTLLQDCIFRRNNEKDVDPGGYAGANKFLWTDHLTFDGVVSYDNIGTGTWFDYASTNFTVRNCTFFGNHAGVGLNLDGKPGGDAPWAGAGFWSEANLGPALIEDNVIYSNLASGIGDLDSGSKGKIVIRNNTIVDCGGCVEFRGMRDKYARGLGSADVIGNIFKAWHSGAWGTSVEEDIPSASPDGMGIHIDGNTYDPGPGYVGRWASWKPSKSQTTTAAGSLEQIRARLDAEAHGKVANVEFRGPLIPVFAYPTRESVLNPDPAKMVQVPSADAESMGMDRALTAKGVKVGSVIRVAVFGRKEIVRAGRHWSCDVYDLQARHVSLSIDRGRTRDALETAVTPYAVIRPVTLELRIRRLEPYRVDASLVSVHAGNS